VAINKAFSNHSGANYWIGVELILVDGRKMSRSLNNAVTIANLKQDGYIGRDIRFFLLGMNYRKPISYSEKALQVAKNTIKRMDTFIYRLQAIDIDVQRFPDIDQAVYDLHHGLENALDDDMNIASALASLFDFISKINTPLAQGQIGRTDAGKVIKALEKINEILGIMDFDEHPLRSDIIELIQKRETARKARKWEEADALRNQLAQNGIEILDGPLGAIWHFK